MSVDNMPIEELKSKLYVKVRTSDDVSFLRKCLDRVDRRLLHAWTDDKGYDLLHHAIISDNIEAVGVIFALGLFKPPHESKQHSYLHVAANMGNKAVVAMLLQERPRDNTGVKVKYIWIKPPVEVPATSASTSSVTPLDVAGDSGHLGCVTTILDFYCLRNRVESGADNHLCVACACNSPSALRLLLKQEPREEDVKTAVGAALKYANVECLDVLLRRNAKLTALFGGMNLYHVLFSYSLSFKKEWYESLLAMTSVLLKHKQNPTSAVPFRTYPLYSLLSHAPSRDFGRTSQYLIACMVLFLNAGVSPNFDEVTFETEHENSGVKTAFGRSSYASALHCLYDNVPNYLRFSPDDTVNIRRYTTKCTEILLRHGADPCIIGPIDDNGRSGNSLHAFLKIALILGIDERSIIAFRMLIQNGADPNLCSSGKFPINICLDEILLNNDVFAKIHKTEEVAVASYITEIAESVLNGMSQLALKGACSVEFDGKPTNQLQRRVFKTVKDEMVSRLAAVWTLRDLCRIVILQSCDRKPTKVIQLPIALALKRFINSVPNEEGTHS